jgi:hypothetical protein
MAKAGAAPTTTMAAITLTTRKSFFIGRLPFSFENVRIATEDNK